MTEIVSPTEWVLRKMVKEAATLRPSYHFLVDAAQICLTQPLSNAVVERGASAVKRIKTRLRNSLKNDMLASLMQMSLNGPPLSDFDAAKPLLVTASRVWRDTHKRNLPPLKLPKVITFNEMITDNLSQEFFKSNIE